MKLTRQNLIKKREVTMRGVFLLSSIFSIFALVAIVVFLLYNSIPAFRDNGFFKILFGTVWNPDADTNPQYGILLFILGSLYTTIMAVLIGVPLGLFTAIFLFKFCHKKFVGTIRQMINLLAGLPSVVFGLFGLMFVVPILRRISPTGFGEGIFAASLILSIMILPTVVSISLNALHAVPRTMYEGALALGATREQAVFRVVLPAAKNGVFASIVLAIGRAIGEAMAVSMVIGLNSNIPKSLFLPANTLAAALVNFGESSGEPWKSALFAIGLVLFLFALGLNTVFTLIRDRKTKTEKKFGFKRKSKFHLPNLKLGYSKTINKVLRIISYVTAALSVLALIGIIIGILLQGLPYVNLHFIFGKHSTSNPSLASALVGTLCIMLIALPISVLIGGASAIFLSEYASKSRLVRYIKIVIETLAGIPSIIYGLFGYAVFVRALGLGKSLLGGGITMSIMLLPIIVRTIEESLLAVPTSLREASFALGASKVRTTFRVVLPSALSGIVSSIILAVGRMVAETSMLILTIGMIPLMPTSVTSGGMSLALNVFYFFQDGDLKLAAATCVVLLVIVLAINLVATLLGKLLTKVKGQE